LSANFVRIIFICVITLFLTSAYANRAKITDVSGQSLDLAKVRLIKGKKFSIVCGGTRTVVPFKAVSVMKIDPAQISAVDGRPHFGVEVQLRDGAVIGNITEHGRCLVAADNGFRGKKGKKARYSAPFSNVSKIEMLGQEAATAQGDDEDDDED